MAEVTSIKCPNCGAPLNFSAEEGKVVCEYCGSSYEKTVLEKLYADEQALASGEKTKDVDWGTETPGNEWEGGEEESLNLYTCPSCGAEVICDDDTIATTCVYCGNPTVLNGRLSGTLKPDVIIPFKKTKKDAIQALEELYKGKRLLPKVFSKENHIEEVKGVYVPFWLFNAKIQADFVFDATESDVVIGDDADTITTRHYRVERGGELEFNKIPVDGSTKMEDRYMDAIEPFDYEGLEPFTMAYLPGYLAEKYDVTAEDSTERVSERMNTSAEHSITATMNYETFEVTRSNIELKEKSAKYALLPVWMLTTRWKDKTYMFAMNGQTGRMVGDLPVSKGRVAGHFFGISGAIFAVFGIIGTMLM